MKFVKLSVLALAMGLFVASCGGGAETEETPAEDTMMTEAPMAAPAPVDTMSTMPADTMHVDTMAH